MNAQTVPSPGHLILNDVRASYLYVHEAYISPPTPQNPRPKPVFTGHFLMPPNHPDLPKIAAAIEAVGAAKWRDQWPAVKAALKGQDRLCLHKGDITKAGKPEYAGLFYLGASNERRPTVVDGDRTPLTNADGRPYSGCYVNAIVEIWAMDNQFGKRINATLTGVQFLRHGDAFSAGPRAAAPEEFGVVAPTGVDAPAPAAAVDATGGLL